VDEDDDEFVKKADALHMVVGIEAP